MDMAAKFQDQTLFHMTGKRAGEGLAPLTADFRPALLARYRDLARLRYDYPVLLLDRDGGSEYVQSLSALVDALIAEMAPQGVDGERLRKQLLRVERSLRALVATNANAKLSDLWRDAAAHVAEGNDEILAVLLRAGETLRGDGELVDCDRALSARFVTRAWQHVNAQKARAFRELVDHLIGKLSDILRAAHAHSAAGRRPAALSSGFGALHGEVFDFDAMSRLVTRNVPIDELPAHRRARLEAALAVLRDQRFYADPSRGAEDAPYGFTFANCAAAIEAHRARLPALIALVKALAIAELESRGAYVEADHDPFFERYDEHALNGDDLAQFPDYLICIPADRNDAPENAALLEMLSTGMPVKVLVEHTDLLEEAVVGQGHFAFGVRSARLATTAMGLGGMFVLQSASSNLVALRDRVRRGMDCRGPALFSVFSGSPPHASALPPYLTAAASMEARAYPAFTYDASAGTNWATRFSLENNCYPSDDWPLEDFEYADDELQRILEPVCFTYADFVIADVRHAQHFAVVPRERWTMAMVPLSTWLELTERDAAERVPYVLAVDANDRLHRVIVDTRLVQATRRCLLLWHRLQEHGGIHNSHAEQAIAREKAASEVQQEQQREQPQDVGAAPVPAAAGSAVVDAAALPADAAPARSPDEAWIETTRCSSCNECQNINDRLFAYDGNKQAFIKDIDAGTYRDLIEAAEACQVAIIHPGKPKNSNEPGLEELLERAKPFG